MKPTKRGRNVPSYLRARRGERPYEWKPPSEGFSKPRKAEAVRELRRLKGTSRLENLDLRQQTPKVSIRAGYKAGSQGTSWLQQALRP